MGGVGKEVGPRRGSGQRDHRLALEGKNPVLVNDQLLELPPPPPLSLFRRKKQKPKPDFSRWAWFSRP